MDIKSQMNQQEQFRRDFTIFEKVLKLIPREILNNVDDKEKMGFASLKPYMKKIILMRIYREQKLGVTNLQHLFLCLDKNF